MRRYRLMRAIIAILLCLIAILPRSVSAHGDDVAYLDFSRTSTSTVLTVALHPLQAYRLVQDADIQLLDLNLLREKRDVIAAYAQDHVRIQAQDRSGEFSACAWVADLEAIVPETELEALADGVTIRGTLACLAAVPKQIEVTTDLFVVGTAEHENIIRTEHPEGFVDRVTLDRTTRTARIDLSVLDTPLASMTTATTTASTTHTENKTSPLVTFVLLCIFFGCICLYHLTLSGRALPGKRV